MGAVAVAAVAVLAEPAVVVAVAAVAAVVDADAASYAIAIVASGAVDELLAESEHHLHALVLLLVQILPSLAGRP